MNLVDNGVSKVLQVERIIEEHMLAFKVTFEDYYGREIIHYVTTSKQVDDYYNDNKHWRE